MHRSIGKAVEIGHIFKLGCRYTESMSARSSTPTARKSCPSWAATASASSASSPPPSSQSRTTPTAFALPPSIAPFDVVVTVTNIADAGLLAAGEKVAADLEAAGFDVLLDDRDERAGVKFKDADLIGIPYRINVGKKAAEGQVELVARARRQTQPATCPSNRSFPETNR